jgi:hypothetical protein
MIIDLILDRKDGIEYNPKEFYNEIMEYETIFDLNRKISAAMDYGKEQDVKEALCEYINKGGYTLDLYKYINSVKWL